MTTADVLMLALGAVAVGAAAAVVTTRHVVRAGLWLVVALGAIAGLYLVLTAELVAWVQVLIYVGAVVVLLLFAVMLTRAPIGASADLDRSRWPGVLIGGGVGLGLAALLVDAYRWSTVEPAGPVRPRSSGRPSSATGCCRSRCSPCSCSPRWSGRSSSPVPTSGAPDDASRHPVRHRRPPVRTRRLRRARPPQRGAAPHGRGADAQRGQPGAGHRRYDRARGSPVHRRSFRPLRHRARRRRGGVGLAIVLQLYRLRQSVQVDEVALTEPEEASEEPSRTTPIRYRLAEPRRGGVSP